MITCTCSGEAFKYVCYMQCTQVIGLLHSGVATLGHTGARALATRGRAPPVQVCMRIIGADSIVVDRESGAINLHEIEWCSIAMYILRITNLVRSLYAHEFAVLYQNFYHINYLLFFIFLYFTHLYYFLPPFHYKLLLC